MNIEAMVEDSGHSVLAEAASLGDVEALIASFRSNLDRLNLFGLEFLVAADIINTVAVEPTIQGLLVPADIVLIRTFLSVSLEGGIVGTWPGASPSHLRPYMERVNMRPFKAILAGASLRDRLLACIGAAFGIALTSLICRLLMQLPEALPLLVAPMGASAVLVFAVPASPLAQPWSVIGGNTISALVGVTVALFVPDPAVAAGLAVGSAILAMSLLRCLHPPGGAAALTAVIGGPAIHAAGFGFAFLPVAANAVLLALTGWAFHRMSGHAYPHRPAVDGGRPATSPQVLDEDVERALADMNETLDVTPADLRILFERVERHAAERRLRTGIAAFPARRATDGGPVPDREPLPPAPDRQEPT